MQRRRFVEGFAAGSTMLACTVFGARPATAATEDKVRGEVVLVPLGKFDDALLDAVERGLMTELQVDVRRLPRVRLPKSAYYPPRKRYRADALLEFLPTLLPDRAEHTRLLGLTSVDISTTKPPHRDWGIFGLANAPGPAAVVSRYRLKRRARDRAQVEFRVVTTAIHEVGHSFGLPHCDEERCPMLDAQGTIANTDSSTGHLGPKCRALLDELAPATSQ